MLCYLAHPAPVPWLGWAKLVETGGATAKQPERHIQGPMQDETGLLLRGRGCWSGRKQLLLGIFEGQRE